MSASKPRLPLGLLALALVAGALVACGKSNKPVVQAVPPPPPKVQSIQDVYTPETDKAKATEGKILDQAKEQREQIDTQ